MKQCFKCGNQLPLADFYPHPKMADGHLGKCKECTKRDSKLNRLSDPNKRSEYERKRNQTAIRKAQKLKYQALSRAQHPEKWKARQAVKRAIRSGKIERKPCEICGTTTVEAHHNDYARPLDVRWLCFKHHREEAHGQFVVACP